MEDDDKLWHFNLLLLKLCRFGLENILQQHETEVLLLQEIVDLKIALHETQAGKMLYLDLQQLLREQRDTICFLVEHAREQSNPQLTQNFEAELKCIQKDFDEMFTEMKGLKIYRRFLECHNSFTYFSPLIFLVYSLHAPASCLLFLVYTPISFYRLSFLLCTVFLLMHSPAQSFTVCLLRHSLVTLYIWTG